MPDFWDKEKLKKSLKKTRKKELEKLDVKVDKTINFSKIKSIARKRAKRIKETPLHGKTEPAKTDFIIHLSYSLIHSRKIRIKTLELVLSQLKRDFLLREISAKEYVSMARPVKEALAEQKAVVSELQLLLDESVSDLGAIGRTPFFIASSHTREKPIAAPTVHQRYNSLFKEEKAQQLVDLEKELRFHYNLTDSDIKKASYRIRRWSKNSLLKPNEIERKAKQAIVIFPRLSQGTQFEREKERAAEIVAEMQRCLKKGCLNTAA